MERRGFLSGIAATALIMASSKSRGQQAGKVWRIGLLANDSGPDEAIVAFREQLGSLGYIEGRNLLIEYRWGAGKEERLPELAAELVRLKVDIIVTRAQQAAAAAKRATSTIPIVMMVADPVGTGLVASLAHPGGNITGVSIQTTDLAGKRVQLLREILPTTTRVAVLALKGGPATPLFLEQVRTAAQQMGIVLVVQEVNDAQALSGAFAAMERAGAQALIVQLNPFTRDHRKQISELAAQHRLPALFESRGVVDAGGFMSYGASPIEMSHRAAFYVDRILKGAKPADLPIEQPTKFELVINLKTAKALGLTVPQSLLLRADEVIQ